jgi:hypothetical protein
MRTIDPRVTDAVLASNMLLAFGILWDSRSQTMPGSGLTGYNRDGRRRFHLYGADPISGVQPLGSPKVARPEIDFGGGAAAFGAGHGLILLGRGQGLARLLATDDGGRRWRTVHRWR